MRLNRVWAWPHQQFRRVLTISLTIFGLPAVAERAPKCQDSLTYQSLKYPREETGYASTRKGIYVFRRGRTFFGTLDGRELLMSRMENSASHYAIVADLVGEEEFQRILQSARPEEEFDRKIYEEVIKHETRSTLIEAARLKARLEDRDEALPLTATDQADVFALLRRMGRLATPLSAWAEPKLTARRFTPIPFKLVDVLMQTNHLPNSFIYKALRITARLNGPQTFIISAGTSGHPDNTHALVLGALKLLLPANRIVSSKSGYLRVVPSADGGAASVQFFEKGSLLPSPDTP